MSIINAKGYQFDHKAIALYLTDRLRGIRKKSGDKHVILKTADYAMIDRRSRALSRARIRASSLGHLKADEQARLLDAVTNAYSVELTDVNMADSIAAELHSEMPWMARATEHVWRSLRYAAVRDRPIQISPMIINGPPGCGKSAFAARVAEMLDLPSVAIDASRGGVGFELVGVERGWSSQCPGKPVEKILNTFVANPMIIVDEICKSKSADTDTGKAKASFTDSLLALLEQSTARRWGCPFYRVDFDLSGLSWLLTSNDTDTIPDVILSRCQVVHVGGASVPELMQFAYRACKQRDLSDPSTDAIMIAVEQSSKSLSRRLSLRDVNRMMQRAQAIESVPTLH